MASAASSGVPVRPSVRLFLPNSFVVFGHVVTVPDRAMRVTGVVRPYVPDQKVKLRVFEGGKAVKVAWARITPSGTGHNSGHFSQVFSVPAPGEATVVVGHTRNAAMRAFKESRTLTVLDEHVGFGSTGRFVVLVQERLAALHFYVPRTGVYDAGTGLAIDAYHRLLHWGTSQNLDGRTISFLLDGFGSFKLRYPHHGRHAEANLSLQLLALSNGPHVQEIFPISSGKPSTPTITGSFRIYSRVPGYLPDGMYYSDFFHHRLRDPRLQPLARLSGQPRLSPATDRRRYPGIQLARAGRPSRRLLLGLGAQPSEPDEARDEAQPHAVDEQSEHGRADPHRPLAVTAQQGTKWRGERPGRAVDEAAGLGRVARQDARAATGRAAQRCDLTLRGA